MTRIFLLRHGQTDVMLTHLAGRLPGIALNRAGRDQAEALADRIAPPDVLITSPVQRARETAAIVGARHGLEATVIEGFAEFDFGDWTGRTFEELQGDPRWDAFNRSRATRSAPGGESMADVQRRALKALGKLTVDGDGQTIAIVSHGDVIRALLLHAAGSSLQNYWRFTVDAASITELSLAGEGSERIIRMNDRAHLERLGPCYL